MGPLEMAVSAVSIDQRDVECGFEGRLVEAGEGAAGIGGLKLRDGVVAAGGFGKIEAAQLVVEDAGVMNLEVALPAGMVAGNVNVACSFSGSRLTVPVCCGPLG